jgi:hypothetical protein
MLFSRCVCGSMRIGSLTKRRSKDGFVFDSQVKCNACGLHTEVFTTAVSFEGDEFGFKKVEGVWVKFRYESVQELFCKAIAEAAKEAKDAWEDNKTFKPEKAKSKSTIEKWIAQAKKLPLEQRREIAQQICPELIWVQ